MEKRSKSQMIQVIIVAFYNIVGMIAPIQKRVPVEIVAHGVVAFQFISIIISISIKQTL